MAMQLEVMKKDGSSETYLADGELHLSDWAKILGLSIPTIKAALAGAGVKFSYQAPLVGGQQYEPLFAPVSNFPRMIEHWQQMRANYLASTNTPSEWHITARYDWTDNIDTSGEFETGVNRAGTRFRWSSTH